jgi:lysophospholipase L1-like esterase
MRNSSDCGSGDRGVRRGRAVWLGLLVLGWACGASESNDAPALASGGAPGSSATGPAQSAPANGSGSAVSPQSEPGNSPTGSSTETTVLPVLGQGGASGSTPSTAPATGGAGGAGSEPTAPVPTTEWIASWVSAQQVTEPMNNPTVPLANSTLRQMAQLGIGGEAVRVHFSNLFGNAPVTITRATFALSAGDSAVNAESLAPLTFAGAATVTIPMGASVTSDVVTRPLEAFQNVVVSAAFSGAVPSQITGHPGSRTTSFIQPGDQTSAANMQNATGNDHWYFLSEIDVLSDSTARAVVTLGDSITDGRGSTTNENDRWPNNLGRRLAANEATSKVSVLNQGVGGNCVLRDCLGVAAISRFTRDALEPPGVRWVVVLEGVNDIRTEGQLPSPNQLENAFAQMAAAAHARNILIYGGTIMPFDVTPAQEQVRQAVNQWIRTSGTFDQVIDFDAITRDPADATRLLPAIDGGDRLHPSAAGYRTIANGIDLTLFE